MKNSTILSEGITSTNDILGGKPCIKDRRIDVMTIVKEIISGSTLYDIQVNFSLTEIEVWNSIRYALKVYYESDTYGGEL